MTLKSRQNNKLSTSKPVLRIISGIVLVFRRLQNHVSLMLLALVGIVLAVGLVTNAYFFSEAVDRVILTQELKDYSQATGRPPFSTNIYIFPSDQRPLTLQEAEKLAQNIAGTLSGEVGLPARQVGIQVSSGSMMLQPAPDSTLYKTGKDYLGDTELIYMANVAAHMKIDAGAPLDESGTGSSDGKSVNAIDVWMYSSLAQEMGIQAGDNLVTRGTTLDAPINLHVAGLWHGDAKDDFWFNSPEWSFKSALFVRRQDYINSIQPTLASRSREASWYIILDENKINPRNGAQYLNGFERAAKLIDQFLPGAKLNAPPLDPLKSFTQRSAALTILLLGYNLPAFLILLYFLAMTSGIIAQWQRKETSVLVSRGMSVSGILMITLVEELLLFLVGYPLGIGFGMLVARGMGYVTSFLSFVPRDALPVSLNGLSLPLTLLAFAITLTSRLWPTAQAARQSVVTEEREWARPSRAPAWYRFYLDLILLLPTYYLYDQMVKRGSLAGLIVSKPEDLYRDPLLIILPALFVLTASLVTMRLFSLVMRVLDALATHTPWLSIHLALRQLGRQSQDYIRPLLLVIVSLAMGIYTMSMAASLDQWLVDRMYYQVGADIAATPQPLILGTSYSDGDWIPAPADFKKIPGVIAATRVGHYYFTINLQDGTEIRGRILAIDRLDYPAAAWYRSDFADEPLGGLMNRLALSLESVLVPRSALTDGNLGIGDDLPMEISLQGSTRLTANFTLAGVYDYLPTDADPNNERILTVVCNMDYLASLIGYIPPHDIWLKVEPGVTAETLKNSVSSVLGIRLENIQDTRAIVATEKNKMERVGIFGTLTVGFLATSLMAILGLLVYSYASLRDRMYRFAVLQAVGLLRRQIVTQVVMEYAFLSLFGSLGGAGIGIMAANLFVPFFRYTGGRGVPLPPLMPMLATSQVQNLIIIFSILVIFVEVVTIASALRRHLIRIS
jgi:putative ABC transport system permease protein